MDAVTTVFLVVICLVAALVLHLWNEHQTLRANNVNLQGVVSSLEAALARKDETIKSLSAPKPKKTKEERGLERLHQQMEDVSRDGVTFFSRKVMDTGGEVSLFYAALEVTGQKAPSGTFPFYVFPQVSLGQIIGAKAEGWQAWRADQAHRAINSKRCDLLLADRRGRPIAVFEYQGGGHDLDGNAGLRDGIKRIALEEAGIVCVEIPARATAADMRRQIREALIRHSPGPLATGGIKLIAPSEASLSPDNHPET